MGEILWNCTQRGMDGDLVTNYCVGLEVRLEGGIYSLFVQTRQMLLFEEGLGIWEGKKVKRRRQKGEDSIGKSSGHTEFQWGGLTWLG